MQNFKKILIANRGEIALRIIRAAEAMNIQTVAVYSAGEENAPHVTHATESLFLGAGGLDDTYLNIEKIIRAALETGAEAIHPGYGFLSENAGFAAVCKENGIIFIGPPAQALELTGDKLKTKTAAKNLGIPVLGSFIKNPSSWDATVAALSYPVLVKSAHGGGGKGMQIINSAKEINEKMIRAGRLANNFFGNGELYLEPYLKNARHIEVQILGDNFGNFIHLFERDCSLQRNYQKIIEVAPAPDLNPQLREKLFEAALRLCKDIGLSGAATVEFLVVGNEAFYFMEINPRIQVEHPVTEEVTGIDIVKEQLRIAAGNPLSFQQKDVKINGHALEVRIYSENRKSGFAPQATPVSFFRFPTFKKVRVETDIATGKSPEASQFDPLLAKLITKGKTREKAFSRMIKALGQTAISGPVTNQQFIRAALQHPVVGQSAATTDFIENQTENLILASETEKINLPFHLVIGAYLFHKFLPEELQTKSPWHRIGFRNILKEAELYIDGSLHTVPFSKLIPRFLKAESKAFETALQKGAVPFRFEWKNETLITCARRTSPHAIKILTEKDSGKLTIHDINPETTGIFLNGIEHFIEDQDLSHFQPDNGEYKSKEDSEDNNFILSHLHGKITDIKATPGQIISKGEILLIIESMKSENHILAPKTAKVKSVRVEVGEQVQENKPLITLEEI